MSLTITLPEDTALHPLPAATARHDHLLTSSTNVPLPLTAWPLNGP